MILLEELEERLSDFKDTIQVYINYFRNDLSLYLRPGIGLRVTTYPYNHGNILKFEFVNDKQKETVEIEDPVIELKAALEKADLQLEDSSGKELNPNFKGTNIINIK